MPGKWGDRRGGGSVIAGTGIRAAGDHLPVNLQPVPVPVSVMDGGRLGTVCMILFFRLMKEAAGTKGHSRNRDTTRVLYDSPCRSSMNAGCPAPPPDRDGKPPAVCITDPDTGHEHMPEPCPGIL